METAGLWTLKLNFKARKTRDEGVGWDFVPRDQFGDILTVEGEQSKHMGQCVEFEEATTKKSFMAMIK